MDIELIPRSPECKTVKSKRDLTSPDCVCPDAWIQAGWFAVVDRTDIIYTARFAGPPLEELDNVMHFIRRHTRIAITIEGLTRTERPEYPLQAVREALVNAVAHADYSQLGAPIRISIFDDRLEIESPGVLCHTA